jgi:uncharacterized protein YndB with AHSA1/START domain
MLKLPLGELKKDGDGYLVRFERHLPYDVNAVWDAITNPSKMSVWFTDIEMDFVVGGKMIIRFRDNDRTESYGRIKRIEPGKLFEYTWENEDGPDELATWELFPEGSAACRLVMTYRRHFDQFAKSVPAGWHVLLDQLGEMLRGRNEPYPFGDGETEEGKAMKLVYTDLWNKTFSTDL